MVRVLRREDAARGCDFRTQSPLHLNKAFSCLKFGLTSLRSNRDAAAYNHDVVPRFRRIIAASPGKPAPSIRMVLGSGTVLTSNWTSARTFADDPSGPPRIENDPLYIAFDVEVGRNTVNSRPVKLSPGLRLNGNPKKNPSSSSVNGASTLNESSLRKTSALLVLGATTVASKDNDEPSEPPANCTGSVRVSVIVSA